MRCRVGVGFGPETSAYSFPGGHPMSSSRTAGFFQILQRAFFQRGRAEPVPPRLATEEELLTFHSVKYVEFVKSFSERGEGFLDHGDTPAFKGVYDASSYVVGTTLELLKLVCQGKVDHGFSPVGGLHHARPDRAGGFCVFNDTAIALKAAHHRYGLGRILYVDIDAHHGDGIYYPFEEEPWLWIADIHEDGRFLYPGTGFEGERGRGEARGTKLNLCLQPGAGDNEFRKAFESVMDFAERSRPEMIFLQAGADSLEGDPLTHLRLTSVSHRLAASRLHRLAHTYSAGRFLAMGGGGYNPSNVQAAWTAVLDELAGH
jgi:acetoin utilization protein AcuC